MWLRKTETEAINATLDELKQALEADTKNFNAVTDGMQELRDIVLAATAATNSFKAGVDQLIAKVDYLERRIAELEGFRLN